MSDLLHKQNACEQWHALLKEAEQISGQVLDDELGSYLVFLLMRFTKETGFASQVVALQYLQALESGRIEHDDTMRFVGDQCLLLSGLFPGRAQRRRVDISYYVRIGQSAYQMVADASKQALSDLYEHIARSFVSMMETLQAMRQVGQPDTFVQLNDKQLVMRDSSWVFTQGQDKTLKH